MLQHNQLRVKISMAPLAFIILGALHFLLFVGKLHSQANSTPKTPKPKLGIIPKGIPPAKNQFGYKFIDTTILASHLKFLASDLMEGRETGKRGQKLAARYIAAHFERLGLKPIGDNGTYFQHFWVKERRVGQNNTMLIERRSLSGNSSENITTFLHDFVFFPSRAFNPPPSISGKVVFAGFGISDAKTYRYDDFAGQNLEGKIVMIMTGEPQQNDSSSRFDGAKPTQWSDSRYKYLAASAAKASAVLIVTELGSDTTSLFDTFKEYHDYISQSSMELTDAPDKGTAKGTKTATPPLYFISKKTANALLAESQKKIETLYETIEKSAAPASFEIPNTKLTLTIDLQEGFLQSENVCGFLEGSDPKLKNEAVILTSHYDHVGMTYEGTVFNGADDDGSGTSTILTLAEAFAKNPIRSKRSMIFMTVSGEEKGLLGSKYYTDNPKFPLTSTYANINMDMVGRVDSTKYEKIGVSDYIYVIGSDKISKDLDDALIRQNTESVNLKLDYTYNDENDPNRFYYRSDHYNFAKNGIPIVFFFDGLHADYHKTTDDVEKIHFPRMAKVAKLAFSLGWELANRREPLRQND
ncbi:MAG: M28 family peptidase [Chloroherpetonaceae bacterium]|nr:M28 family peptidase [Chloroherpetonaceae bacterium]